MRMVDAWRQARNAAAMVAFLAFMDLRAASAPAAIAVATVVLELMFKNSARLSPAQNDARGIWLRLTLEPFTAMPVVKSYQQVDAAVSAVRSAYARSRNVNETELAFSNPSTPYFYLATRSTSVSVIVIVCISFLNGTIPLLLLHAGNVLLYAVPINRAFVACCPP